jgi:hypothetical protein
MKTELLQKISLEQAKYESIRQELLKVDHLKNIEEVDKFIEMLGESNKILDTYHRAYRQLIKEEMEILS